MAFLFCSGVFVGGCFFLLFCFVLFCFVQLLDYKFFRSFVGKRKVYAKGEESILQSLGNRNSYHISFRNGRHRHGFSMSAKV